jgi:hypothetical protein
MDWPPISKSPANLPVQPNLVDYDKARAGFSWEAIRKELGGLPNGGLNIAHEAVDRHAAGPRRDHLALRWLGADGATRDFTYRDLAEGSSRFANGLRELGTGKGDRVFALAGRIPELYISALGTLKNPSVFCPLFSAFGKFRQGRSLHGDPNASLTPSLRGSALGAPIAAALGMLPEAHVGTHAEQSGPDCGQPVPDGGTEQPSCGAYNNTLYCIPSLPLINPSAMRKLPTSTTVAEPFAGCRPILGRNLGQWEKRRGGEQSGEDSL